MIQGVVGLYLNTHCIYNKYASGAVAFKTYSWSMLDFQYYSRWIMPQEHNFWSKSRRSVHHAPETSFPITVEYRCALESSGTPIPEFLHTESSKFHYTEVSAHCILKNSPSGFFQDPVRRNSSSGVSDYHVSVLQKLWLYHDSPEHV